MSQIRIGSSQGLYGFSTQNKKCWVLIWIFCLLDPVSIPYNLLSLCLCIKPAFPGSSSGYIKGFVVLDP